MFNARPNLTERRAMAEALTSNIIRMLEGRELDSGMADRIMLATLAAVDPGLGPRSHNLTGSLVVRNIHNMLRGCELSEAQAELVVNLAKSRVRPQVDEDGGRACRS